MKSANEIDALVLKAARGGGVPLGHAEDLAAAAPFLDLDGMARCPCSGGLPAALAIPIAIDLVEAGEGPQEVAGDRAVIAAYVAAAIARTGRALVWEATGTGAVFHRFDGAADAPASLGRRVVPAQLEAHLAEMAAKTLVPETEASRVGGAGAGLTDND